MAKNRVEMKPGAVAITSASLNKIDSAPPTAAEEIKKGLEELLDQV
jgi:hypothetical protein